MQSTQCNLPSSAHHLDELEVRTMKKMILLSSILLLSAVFALAQYGSQDNSSQSSASNAGMMTVQGCLSGSDGNFSLMDSKSGTTYQLTGDTARLQMHVGHTIQVTGTNAAGPANGQTGAMSSPSDSHPTLMVSSFKHVSATCAPAQ
jgi:hypothetical protein